MRNIFRNISPLLQNYYNLKVSLFKSFTGEEKSGGREKGEERLEKRGKFGRTSVANARSRHHRQKWRLVFCFILCCVSVRWVRHARQDDNTRHRRRRRLKKHLIYTHKCCTLTMLAFFHTPFIFLFLPFFASLFFISSPLLFLTIIRSRVRSSQY